MTVQEVTFDPRDMDALADTMRDALTAVMRAALDSAAAANPDVCRDDLRDEIARGAGEAVARFGPTGRALALRRSA